MNKLYLWDLAGQYQTLMASLVECDELAPEVLQQIEAMEGALQEKLIGCAHVVMNMESAAMAIQDAAAKQQARGQRLAERAKQLRQYMLSHARATGIKRIEHTDFVLKIVNNTPSVIIDDPRQIPASFMRTPEPEPPPQPVPDKPALAKALKEGIEVPGAHLFRGQRIDISL